MCIFCVFALPACRQPADAPATLEPLDFSTLQQVSLNVERIEIIRNYIPPARYPNVDHLFPTPPYEALDMWAKQTLHAGGKNSGVVTVEIHDASVKETPLNTKDGITGLLTVEPSERYDARMEVAIKLYTPDDALPAAEAGAVVKLSREIREDATLDQRDALFQNMTDELIKLMDKQIRQQINQYFAPYILH